MDHSQIVGVEELRKAARPLVLRVANGDDVSIEALREFAALTLRCDLVQWAQRLQDAPPEFAVRRAMDLYIQWRDTEPRATWFHAADLPGVTGKDQIGLACKLVDAVQPQNTGARSKRTYHLVISLHPNDRCLE